MKTFRDFLKEDVLPTAQVADGSLDISKPAVRAAINAAIAGVTSQPAVTPYVVYNRLSKLLAQYHIILPKKFLEGDKGVEVFEVKQFGHKMGMTDSGEFVNEVPSTHYLFLQYGILSPFGITYAKPVVGGMFRVAAKLVDKDELDKLLDMAEITMNEEAECRQMSAKANAPKEPMHDITSDEKKKGNKEAVADSEKGLDEELSHGARELTLHADNDSQLHRSSHQPIVKNLQRKHAKGAYDHDKATKLWGYHANRAAKSYEKQHGGKFSVADRKAAASHFADSARDEHGFGKSKVDEGWASIGLPYDKNGYRNPHAKIYTSNGRKSEGPKDPHPGESEPGAGDTYKGSKQGGKTRFAKSVKEDKDPCWKGYEMVGMKKKGGKRVPNCVPVKEETLGEGRMPASVIAHKQKLANMSDKEFSEKHGHKSEKELRDMAARHGYGWNKETKTGSDHYVKRLSSLQKEEKGDRLTPGFSNRKDFDTIAKEIGTGKGGMTIVDKAPKGDSESKQQTIYPMSPKSTSRVAPDDVEKKLDQTTPGNPQAERNRDLHEKLTKKMSARDVISDFVHSKAKTFEDDTKKKRINRALGAYYGMHPEKSKK